MRANNKEESYDTFLAGLLGGYYVFGRHARSSVNQQIVTYVFARVVLALAKMSVQKGGIVPGEMRQTVTGNAWPVFAAVSWGAVMWLFRWHADSLQPGLKGSMQYMCVETPKSWIYIGEDPPAYKCDSYADSDHWTCFKNFLVYNK
jgi:peroxisomal membrane protein 4